MHMTDRWGRGIRGRWRPLLAVQQAAFTYRMLPCILTVWSDSEVSRRPYQFMQGICFHPWKLYGIMLWGEKTFLTYKYLSIHSGVQARRQERLDRAPSALFTFVPVNFFPKNIGPGAGEIIVLVKLQQCFHLTLPLGPLRWRKSCYMISLQESKWPELNWEKKAILRVLAGISSNIIHMSNMCLCCFSCDLHIFILSGNLHCWLFVVFWPITFIPSVI